MTVDIRRFLVKTPQNMKNLKKGVVTEVREKKTGRVNPVIVTFQNGDLNENHASDFSVLLSSNPNGGTDVEIEASYGHLFKDAKGEESFKQTQVIAIRSRKTNKVKLVEVDSALLINSALLHGSKAANETSSTYIKDLKALNKAFGGKKIVSRIEQKDKLNVTSMLVADEVKDSVANLKIENISSIKSNETESINDLLPPCNRKAQTVSEVYVLNEILNNEELEALKEEVMGFKKLSPDEYSPFFIYCYEEAKRSEDNLIDRLGGVLFTETLIKFLKTPSKKLTSKTLVLCQFSSIIHTKLLNEFCVRTDSSVTRPLTMRDKTLCYIIAICLICCNYQINLKLLASVVSVHLVKLARLARVVGAIPLSKDEHTFVLRLPLPPLPKTSKGKVQRK